MNIVLAGMPLSGKTTIAKVFSERGVNTIDTDEEIVKKYGNINDIFANFGEKHFRDLETEIVESLSALSDTVISTGGGCLLRERNVELLKSYGKIVFLRTRPETLVNRVGGDKGRPLLKDGAEQAVYRLYRERTPVYERAADIIIDTDELTPEQIADKITEIIK